jgi:hypothetical protein
VTYRFLGIHQLRALDDRLEHGAEEHEHEHEYDLGKPEAGALTSRSAW